jgi:DDE superfamily endonuclease
MGNLTKNFQTLLFAFQGNFTQPSFPLFCAVMTGWALSIRHRYITELIYASDRLDDGHWSRYHRFFSRNAWSLDSVCLTLISLLIDAFASTGIIALALDDTLCRKRGLNLYGAGMHHDPLISSKAVKLVSWGHDWVVLTLIVCCPFWASTKVFSLPIAFRLYRNRQGNNKGKKKNEDQDARSRVSKSKARKKTQKPKKQQAVPANKAPAEPHRTRPELGVELIQLVANAFPSRTFVVVGDSLYGGQSVLSHLPANVHLISRVHPKGALYAPAAAEADSGKRGRKRRKGIRLSSMEDWAKDSTRWTNHKFDQYGLHANLSVKTRQGLYYKAGKDRLLTFVLVRDNSGKRPLAIFYCTLLDWTVRQILSTYAARWSIEVAFENGKQLLGFEDPANRVPKAVKRTAPMAMILVSLTTLWFHQYGHQQVKFPFRPWYRRKKEPSFADMLGTLRRLSWKELWKGAGSSDRKRNKVFSQLAEFASRAG